MPKAGLVAERGLPAGPVARGARREALAIWSMPGGTVRPERLVVVRATMEVLAVVTLAAAVPAGMLQEIPQVRARQLVAGAAAQGRTPVVRVLRGALAVAVAVARVPRLIPIEAAGRAAADELLLPMRRHRLLRPMLLLWWPRLR